MSVDEWDQREVCPDGTCVGVIGGDGLCKVCGRAAQHWGDERKRGTLAEPTAGEAPEPLASSTAPDDSEDYEWSRRRLCPDEACVGLLGPNGVCKVCGKGGPP